MPVNRRPIIPEAAWPDLCAIGRKLRLACETAQDYIEKAKGRDRIAQAHKAKQNAEDDLQAHLAKCDSCTDSALAARARLRAKYPKTTRRVRPARPGKAVDAAPLAGSKRPQRYDPSSPETHPLIQYAIKRLEGSVVRVRNLGAQSGGGGRG